MFIWDYQLPPSWQPATKEEWEWYLVRKINYGDFDGLKKKTVRKYFAAIQQQLDPGKRLMLENFLKNIDLYFFKEKSSEFLEKHLL